MATRLLKAKCQVCGRMFATAAALKQHSLAMHKVTLVPNKRVLTPRATKAPVSGPSSNRVSGSDIIAVAAFKTTNGLGKVLYQSILSPRALSGSRLEAHARLWNRWRPVSLKVSVVTGSSTLVGGTYVLGWTASVTDRYSGTLSTIQKIGSYRPSLESNLFTPASITVPCGSASLTHKWYETHSRSDEESSHGALVMAVSSPLQGLVGVTDVGLRIHLDWSVEFDSPDIPDQESREGMYADDSYTPYFTDSVSDWADGKALTLKHKLGGHVVPFPDSDIGVVYKLDGRASLLAFKSASETTPSVVCLYAARIWNYSVAGLAVFADLAKAKEYAASGEVTKCLEYFKAGPFIAPENPAWYTVFDQSVADSLGAGPNTAWKYSVEDTKSQATLSKIRSLISSLADCVEFDTELLPQLANLRVIAYGIERSLSRPSTSESSFEVVPEKERDN